MQADILRKKFLDFFKAKKHRIVESDSLVPQADPTVLFTPAGMNQFKKEFLGFDAGFRRAATCQRCLRTDDLDKVGKTSGHHTFFEMLGNFSFGDYFKEEAISYAWEFLTQELKIPQERLWVSVYKDDAQAYKIWEDFIGVAPKRIIKLGDKENFWPSEAKKNGPNGPCGPCSEIFFDQGKTSRCLNPDCNPACACGRFVEVWNLVFTQFNRKQAGLLEPLPKKNIDTGMGLERLAALMQGAPNNFETDLFQPIIKEILLHKKDSLTESKEAIYAVSDHIRAIVFAIYDGVIPSNEERGYVIRKLIRKSVLHLQSSLGIKNPFLYKLVPVLSEVMKAPYPELGRRKENISEIILSEERNFIASLKSSRPIFEDKFKDLSNKQDAEKAGAIAFQLYDTYGIPFELSKSYAQESGISISLERFNKELGEQKRRSRLESAMKGDVFSEKRIDYGRSATQFLGYKDYSLRAKILKIITGEAEAKKINKGDSAVIILDKSVFYPESGGQVGDTGVFIKGENSFEVLDTKREGKIILHKGIVKSGSFKKSDFVLSKINFQRRLSISRNHTATHLLQAALRQVLGAHVQQQGSLVAEEKLRFDFTHFKDIDRLQLDRIEETVNDWIISNYPVNIKQKSLKEAKSSGALAFFAEKYEGRVRLVSIGDLSFELCGGAHLEYTGQIGLFKIIQEGSVSSGIRRIEAVTGSFAYKIIKAQEAKICDIEACLNVPVDNIKQEIAKRAARVKELEKQLNLRKIGSFKETLEELVKGAESINEVKVITKIFQDLEMDLLRKNMDLLKEKTTNSVIALGSKIQGRALLVIGVTSDLCLKGLDASRLIQDIAKLIGGSGGGRQDFAQAGGRNPESLQKAIDELKNTIKNLP